MSALVPCWCGHVSPLCERCIGDALDHLAGTAHVRGIYWALRIARARGVDREWSATDVRMLECARRQVSDLASDEGLLVAFVEHVIAGASAEWAKLRADPDRLRRSAPVRVRRRRE